VSVVVGTFARIVSKGLRRDASAEPRLPQGAEAALWSITEAVPDPRNHLAMVRDLSGEVRVTDVEQAMLVHAYENRVPNAPPVTDRSTPPEPRQLPPHQTKLEAPREAAIVDVRDAAPPAMDPYYDLGEIAENAPLTDHLFTPATD
jgi:hypothetical protein